jgi:hypothetical protein
MFIGGYLLQGKQRTGRLKGEAKILFLGLFLYGRLQRCPKRPMIASISRIRRNIKLKKALFRAFPQSNINFRAVRRVAIFPQNKIAFTRIRKNANTTTMIYLSYIEHGVLYEGEESKKSIHLHNADEGILHRLSQYRFLVIKRNPYSRVLSAFLQKFAMEEYKQRYRPFPLSPRGFSDFAYWLQDGGINKNPHWDLQINDMLLPINKYTDVIPFEEYDNSFAKFLQKFGSSQIGRNFQGIAERGTRNKTNSSEIMHKFYDKNTMSIISKLYERDFIELSYEIIE